MNKFFKTVLLTGLFVGTTDILSAFITIYITSGKFPGKMFNYIAGAALGASCATRERGWTRRNCLIPWLRRTSCAAPAEASSLSDPSWMRYTFDNYILAPS